MNKVNRDLKLFLLKPYDTLADAAEAMQLNPSELSNLIRGRRKASPRIVKAFQKVFGDEALHLLEGEKASEAQ